MSLLSPDDDDSDLGNTSSQHASAAAAASFVAAVPAQQATLAFRHSGAGPCVALQKQQDAGDEACIECSRNETLPMEHMPAARYND